MTEQEFGQLKQAVHGLKLETKKRHYARPTQIVGLSDQAHTAVVSSLAKSSHRRQNEN